MFGLGTPKSNLEWQSRFLVCQIRKESQHGEAILQIFDTMESLGGTRYTNDQLQGLIAERLWSSRLLLKLHF